MKVVLRSPVTSDGRRVWSLTVGRYYEVLGIESNYFRILDDTSEPMLFDPACFELVDSTEPPFWVSKVGEDGERYAYPPGWGVPGFFEAWHDGFEVIRRVFAEQLSVWYPETAHKREDKRGCGQL